MLFKRSETRSKAVADVHADLPAAAWPFNVVSEAAVNLHCDALEGCHLAALPAAMEQMVPGWDPPHPYHPLCHHGSGLCPRHIFRLRCDCVPRGLQELWQGEPFTSSHYTSKLYIHT